MQIDQKLANYFKYYENISLSKSCKIFIFQYFLDSKLKKKKQNQFRQLLVVAYYSEK